MIRRRRTVLAVAAALLPLLCTACGYHLSGTGAASTLPEDVTNFVVQPFENRTNRPEIEQRVTEEVASRISRRGRYKVVANATEGHAVLTGAITSYQTNAVQFGSSGRATRVEAVVQVQATLREIATDEVLWSQAGLLFREQFDVPDTGAFIDEETLALDEIAAGVASTLVNSIFEGF